VGLQIVLTKSRIYEDRAICVGDAQVGGLVEKDSCAASFAISATKPVRPVPHGPVIEDLV